MWMLQCECSRSTSKSYIFAMMLPARESRLKWNCGAGRGREKIDQHRAEFAGGPCPAGFLHALGGLLPVDRDVAVVLPAVLVHHFGGDHVERVEIGRAVSLW